MQASRQAMLKNFTIGFIPILVFLMADYIYGPFIGIIVAVAFGFAELLFFYLKNKQIEKFILFDVGLLVVFGSVSILLENDFFFLIKPAVLEFILVIVLGIHGFTSIPVLFLIGRRYMRDMTIQPIQERLMKNMARLMAVVFLAHTALIVISALYWSKEVWAFISGGLFYIIFAIILAGQWFYIKYIKKSALPAPKQDEEWFDLVDEKGRVIGKASRSQVHGNPDLLHPTVHIQIFNKQGRIFLQKRSKQKDLFPGRWDTAVGGHVNSGEDIKSAVLREAKEELGINAVNIKPLFRYIMRNKWESELIHSFKLVSNGPFNINKDEIDEGRFWTLFEIRKNLDGDTFTPNFIEEFKMMEKSGII